MPSNYTPNYGLSQWEGTDAFFHEDFNADNEILDAALSGIAKETACLSYVTIAATTLSKGSDLAVLDLSGVDLSEYVSLDLYAVPQISTSEQAYYDIFFNGAANQDFYISADAGEPQVTQYLFRTHVYDGFSGQRQFDFAPMNSGSRIASYSPYYGAAGEMQLDMGMSVSLTWDAVTEIDFQISTGRFGSGSRFWLCGVRKV